MYITFHLHQNVLCSASNVSFKRQLKINHSDIEFKYKTLETYWVINTKVKGLNFSPKDYFQHMQSKYWLFFWQHCHRLEETELPICRAVIIKTFLLRSEGAKGRENRRHPPKASPAADLSGPTAAHLLLREGLVKGAPAYWKPSKRPWVGSPWPYGNWRTMIPRLLNLEQITDCCAAVNAAHFITVWQTRHQEPSWGVLMQTTARSRGDGEGDGGGGEGEDLHIIIHAAPAPPPHTHPSPTPS